jgi:sugar/nucleoside kinase (ribokinase family)
MENQSEIQVVVAGHICIDLIPSFSKENYNNNIISIFEPGKTLNMETINISTGGPVSNTGIGLSKLGIKCRLMGKIGDDYLGEAVIRFLNQKNVENDMIIAKGEETSYTVVIAPPGYDRMYMHSPGANNIFCSDDINYNIVKKAKLFHFGYPPVMRRMFENNGDELVNIFKKVKEVGVTTSLDMAPPDVNSESGNVDWKRILQRVLPYVDIYIPSVEETMFMIQREDYDYLNENSKGNDILDNLDINKLQGLGEKLISYGVKIAVIKCGVKGYYIRTQGKEVLAAMGTAAPKDPDNWVDRELYEESFHVLEVASATGSGDSSIAGFLASFLNGRTIEESIRIACAVGGQNVQVFDAVSGIKSWDETMAMIPEWDKNRLSIEGSYWRYDDNKKVWFGRKDKSNIT